MTSNDRRYRWAIPLTFCVILGMPAMISSLSTILLLNGEVLRGLVSMLAPVAFAAWYWWDTRHSWEQPSELLKPMAIAWACGIPLGSVAWLIVLGARWLMQ